MFLSRLIVLWLSLLLAVESSCEVTTDTLCVNQVTAQGFGDITNRYAFAMQTFQGAVHVATLNAVHAPAGIVAFARGNEFESNGAQIYRGNLNETAWSWTQIESGGLGDVWNYGVRKFAAVGDFLYAVTGNAKYGFEIWRSKGEQEQFARVMAGGFGNSNNTSGRGMGGFDNYLYVGTENRESGAQMYRREMYDDGEFVAGSDWDIISNDGFGDAENVWFSDMTEFKGYLYAGTLNDNGMQLWRSSDGKTFENVFEHGNGAEGNKAAMKLYVYEGRLYIGTMNFLRGASLWVNEDSEGLVFVPVLVGGNGNHWNAYLWYLQAFNGRLYVGTFDMSEDGWGIPGFDLFSSKEAMPDSKDWIKETTDGFGNPGQVGIRTMGVTEDGQRMMIGSATSESELGCIVFEAVAMNRSSAGDDW